MPIRRNSDSPFSNVASTKSPVVRYRSGDLLMRAVLELFLVVGSSTGENHAHKEHREQSQTSQQNSCRAAATKVASRARWRFATFGPPRPRLSVRVDCFPGIHWVSVSGGELHIGASEVSNAVAKPGRSSSLRHNATALTSSVTASLGRPAWTRAAPRLVSVLDVPQNRGGMHYEE